MSKIISLSIKLNIEKVWVLKILNEFSYNSFMEFSLITNALILFIILTISDTIDKMSIINKNHECISIIFSVCVKCQIDILCKT